MTESEGAASSVAPSPEVIAQCDRELEEMSRRLSEEIRRDIKRDIKRDIERDIEEDIIDEILYPMD